jgi:putative FmdB family regulatory protein
MPIYEYECKSCGNRQEVIQKLSDAPLTDCPDCGEAELKKLVSAAGFRLKGGGWYETDFKSGNKRNVVDGAKADSPKAAAASTSCCSGGACASD